MNSSLKPEQVRSTAQQDAETKADIRAGAQAVETRRPGLSLFGWPGKPRARARSRAADYEAKEALTQWCAQRHHRGKLLRGAASPVRRVRQCPASTSTFGTANS